jgi:hypothetical protein
MELKITQDTSNQKTIDSYHFSTLCIYIWIAVWRIEGCVKKAAWKSLYKIAIFKSYQFNTPFRQHERESWHLHFLHVS